MKQLKISIGSIKSCYTEGKTGKRVCIRFYKMDLVSILLGGVPVLERIVYVVVALAAIYLAILTPKLSK